MDLHYCRGGAGFILYRGRQALWETVTEREMLDYLRANNLQAEYRRTHITIIT